MGRVGAEAPFSFLGRICVLFTALIRLFFSGTFDLRI
jgi:hypothetical protein